MVRKTTPPTVNEKLEKFRNAQTKTKGWLWVGVIGISGIIFFFWGWSLVSNISLFDWKKTQEKTMIQRTQSDWNELFTETEAQQQNKKKVSQELGAIITEIKKQAEAEQTTTTSSTITSSTMENIITTSTIR